MGNQQMEEVENIPKWKQWCRLCAKEDPETNIDIFIKGEQSSELTVSHAIEKYFWINISHDDDYSKSLCVECFALVTSLMSFSERVSKVQTMFSLLHTSNPLNTVDLHQIRSQYGLLDEDREHIICHPSTEIHYFETKPKIANLISSANHKNNYDPIEENTHNLNDDCDDIEYVEEIRPFTPSNIKKEMQVDDTSNNNENDNNKNIWNNEELLDKASCDSDNNGRLHWNVSNASPSNECDENRENNYKLIDTTKQRKSKRIYKLKSSMFKKKRKVKAEIKKQRQKEQGIYETNEDECDDDENGNGDDDDDDDDGEVGDDYSNDDDTKSRKVKREAKYNCTECPKKFKLVKHYRQHMRNAHDIKIDVPEFPCDFCAKTFLTEKLCDAHRQTHMPTTKKKPSIACPHCDKKFLKHKILEKHVNGVHMNQKPFICEECGRLLKTIAALKEHKLTHTEDRPFECDVCQKKFKNKARLKIHADIHTNTNYICTECGLVLNTRRTLKMHMLVHSDQKRFKCDYCGTEFKRAKALKNHLILHTGLKPYTCNFCHKTFANGSNCRSHKKKTHPEELAAMEAAGAKTVQTNIPKLEQLRAVTKASENLNPVVSKQSGCFSTSIVVLASNTGNHIPPENTKEFLQQQPATNQSNCIDSNNIGGRNAVCNETSGITWKKLNNDTVIGNVCGDSHSSFADAASTKSHLDVVHHMPAQTVIIPMPLHMQFQQQNDQFSHGLFDSLPIGS